MREGERDEDRERTRDKFLASSLGIINLNLRWRRFVRVTGTLRGEGGRNFLGKADASEGGREGVGGGVVGGSHLHN